jgi:diaminohydroxyphosphoribosylaminopyrimidine deaminase/5-amino-6-(5-phosphoribosylamino)uracil reductase
MVGAVLVYNGSIIGEGWHQQYGQPHAEVNCFNSVAAADKHLIPESTMYVSLEPCAHFGKTPPCAIRIVSEGVKKVVICNADPFAKVSGKGIEILRQNGVDITVGVLDAEGLWLNRRFFTMHTQHRPYIILKWAQTTNGLFAPLNRTRYQLSNAHSKQLLHKWRTEEAAIMVGFNTAMSDDPQLTSRMWQGRQPLRIVLDEHLELPTTHRVFDTEAHTWIVNNKLDKQEYNVRYLRLDFGNNLINELLNEMHKAGILSLIVEGGAHLLNSYIEQGLWDEARIFFADADMPEGIVAPTLPNATLMYETELNGDILQLHTNNKAPYAYVQGMEL